MILWTVFLFEVENSYENEILTAFTDYKYKGMNVVVELSKEKKVKKLQVITGIVIKKGDRKTEEKEEINILNSIIILKNLVYLC